MSTYVEEDDAFWIERPLMDPPDLSKDDHADAARVNREQVQS